MTGPPRRGNVNFADYVVGTPERELEAWFRAQS